MILPEGTSAEDFAKYIAEEKPYLIEIEDEIQTSLRSGLEGTLKVDIHIRGGNVVNLDFWRRKHWNRYK